MIGGEKIVTPDMMKKVGEAVGPNRFFFLVVIPDGAQTCDVGASARNPTDISNATAMIKNLFPVPHNRN